MSSGLDLPNGMDINHHLVVLRLTITPALEHTYATLNILSITLVSILLVTITASKRLKRDPTLLNAFVVLVVVDFVNILYYIVRRGDPLAGNKDGVEDGDGVGLPAMGVCRGQACILAGSQAAQAAAVFGICLQVSWTD